LFEQKIWSALHVVLQLPSLQTYPTAQTLPQAPQLLLSVAVVAQ
jgi:hypothetical protein